MKNNAILSVIWIFFISACAPAVPEHIGYPAGLSKMPTSTPSAPAYRTPPANASWQIQYSGEMNYNLDVAIYNLDLFDTSAETIQQLHQRGIFVMCYFSAGSHEDWRPDANQFPAQILGKKYESWQGETWLDIRADALKPIISARLDTAAQKGCDGVDPDNVNGYENDTGFPLTYNDQITYNIWLADQAHARGLSIGLKNDLEQIRDLQPYFDWALNESCFRYHECDLLLPFVQAGKPVFVIEYDLIPKEFCPQANELGFNALKKNLELDSFSAPCGSG